MKALGRLLSYLRAYRKLAFLALFCLIAATAGNLAVPGLGQHLIDRGIVQHNQRLILLLAGAIVGVALVRAVFSFYQGYLTAKISQGVAYDLRNALYAKIQKLSFSYHDRTQTGQLLTRVTSDVELAQQFLGTAFLQAIGGLLMLVGSVILMVRTDAPTAAVLLVLGPVAVFLFFFFFRKTRPLFVLAQQKLSQLNVALQENLAGVRVVRAFARQAYEIRRFARHNREVMEVQLKVRRTLAFAMPLIFFIANLSTAAVIWLGGHSVIAGRMTIGELSAFTNYILMAIFPIFMLSFLMGSIAQAAAGSQRIFEILDTPLEIQEKPDAVPLPPIEGRVEFRDVWFRYFESQPWVLQAVNFVVQPGQKIALLGATGSGKSTIINLIPRFYDATRGQVLIDGYDVRDVTLASLRRQIGIVLQDTLLFSGTIRENIAFGKPEATMEEIIAAAKAAQAHDFITAFPEGYETPVGERGVTLSGGQKQRIAIARALLVDPRILILDDATSSVDFQTEQRLRKALAVLMEGRTSFIIAQRISTVLDADLILVLDKGRIVAQGRHEELLESSPLYAEIYYGELEEDVAVRRRDRFIYDASQEVAR